MQTSYLLEVFDTSEEAALADGGGTTCESTLEDGVSGSRNREVAGSKTASGVRDSTVSDSKFWETEGGFGDAWDAGNADVKDVPVG